MLRICSWNRISIDSYSLSLQELSCLTACVHRWSTNGWPCKLCLTSPATWRMCGLCWSTLPLTFVTRTRYIFCDSAAPSKLPIIWVQFSSLIWLWVSFPNQSYTLQVYSLIGGFCASAVNFHAKDGSGYKFLADVVLQLDKLNPQVGSAHYVTYLKCPPVHFTLFNSEGEGSSLSKCRMLTDTLLCLFPYGGVRLHHAWFRLSRDGGGLMKKDRRCPK